jgi:hypothetical protein
MVSTHIQLIRKYLDRLWHGILSKQKKKNAKELLLLREASPSEFLA